jgi:large-conductance mechanosensitive channel
MANRALDHLTVAAAAFFIVLKPYQAYSARLAAGLERPVPLTTDQQLLSENRDLIKARGAGIGGGST